MIEQECYKESVDCLKAVIGWVKASKTAGAISLSIYLFCVVLSFLCCVVFDLNDLIWMNKIVVFGYYCMDTSCIFKEKSGYLIKNYVAYINWKNSSSKFGISMYFEDE